MNEYINAFIYGAFQGLTEFLPISSSAHLSLLRIFFGVSDIDTSYDVFLHLGTLLAVILYYRAELVGLLCCIPSLSGDIVHGRLSPRKLHGSPRRLLCLFFATLPLVVVYFFGIKQLVWLVADSSLLIGLLLALNGIMLIFTERVHKSRIFYEMSYTDSFIIGLSQCFATLPGLSRSGTTTCFAMLCGIPRRQALAFSFILGIPTIIGANLTQLPSLASCDISLRVCITGFLGAFMFGVLAIRVLEKISKKSSFTYFGIYCIAMGVFAVVKSIII